MRRFIYASSFLALAAACGDGDSTQLLGGQTTDETIAVTQFELRTSLPSCGKSTTGNVFYIVKDEALVYCDGKKYQDVEFPCDPTWLVSAGAAASCAHGGSTLKAGPDKNGNGKLDSREVVSTGTACNGAPGAPGKDGLNGIDGMDGSSCSVQDNGDRTYTLSCTDGTWVIPRDGADGADGAQGPQGPAGPAGQNGQDGQDGADGSSCSIRSNGDSTYTVTCTDGTSIILHDGADGAPGANGAPGATGPQGPAGQNGATGATGPRGSQGPQGPQGPAGSSCNVEDDVAVPGGAIIRCENGFAVRIFDGEDGQDGADGSSCSVHDNGDGTYWLACTDGTSVTVRDGDDGAPGATGAQGPQGVPGATGPQGPAGIPQDGLIPFSTGNSTVSLASNSNGDAGSIGLLGFGAATTGGITGTPTFPAALPIAASAYSFNAVRAGKITGLTFSVDIMSAQPRFGGANIPLQVSDSTPLSIVAVIYAAPATSLVYTPIGSATAFAPNGNYVVGTIVTLTATQTMNFPVAQGTRLMVAFLAHYPDGSGIQLRTNASAGMLFE